MNSIDLGSVEPALRTYLLDLARKRGADLPALDRHDPLIERGVFDSMSLLDFVVFTERLCGIKIPGEDVDPEHFGTLDAILTYLRGRG